MVRKKIVEIVLDTETTGLDYTRERMVEFAAVRLENGKIKDEFQTLINLNNIFENLVSLFTESLKIWSKMPPQKKKFFLKF